MDNQLPFFLDTYFPLSTETVSMFEEAYQYALKLRHEFVTPEHLLNVLMNDKMFLQALDLVEADIIQLDSDLKKYIDDLDKVPEGIDYSPMASLQFNQLVKNAEKKVMGCGKTTIELSHIINELLFLEESNASFLLFSAIKGATSFFISAYLGELEFEPIEGLDIDDDIIGRKLDSIKKTEDWKNMVVCVNDVYTQFNPLVGREEEMKKTIRVLCRKDKNNPLHIGEPGVGKTAMVYGLAALIEEDKVPEKLKDAKIYRIDLGNLIAGTQFRGDFEKKIKLIMEGVGQETNAIVYIDEIHNLVGAGATNEGSLDASNFLKPYLESGAIRFIGSTTYDEYKRHFAKSKGIVRRFTNIDIEEPSVDEAINILKQLQPHYEEFHQVKYTDEAVE